MLQPQKLPKLVFFDVYHMYNITNTQRKKSSTDSDATFRYTGAPTDTYRLSLQSKSILVIVDTSSNCIYTGKYCLLSQLKISQKSDMA